MGRPGGVGIPYFPVRVDFFADEKIRLIKGEFGLNGICIVIALLCEIYGDNGYFKEFGDVQRTLLAEKLGSGVKPNLIAEVVNGCFRCGLFDKDVSDAFGVLTSAGIQRRYLRAAGKREFITVIGEYWLLNADDPDDVPASIRPRILYKKITGNRNKVSVCGNPKKTGNKPQSKVNNKKASICAQDRFALFWAAYPNKKDKVKAQALFEKILAEEDLFDTIMSALELQKKTADWLKEGGKFIPMPSTWLRNCRWTDEIAPPQGEQAQKKRKELKVFGT